MMGDHYPCQVVPGDYVEVRHGLADRVEIHARIDGGDYIAAALTPMAARALAADLLAASDVGVDSPADLAADVKVAIADVIQDVAIGLARDAETSESEDDERILGKVATTFFAISQGLQ